MLRSFILDSEAYARGDYIASLEQGFHKLNLLLAARKSQQVESNSPVLCSCILHCGLSERPQGLYCRGCFFLLCSFFQEQAPRARAQVYAPQKCVAGSGSWVAAGLR